MRLKWEGLLCHHMHLSILCPTSPLLGNVWDFNLEMHHICTGHASWSNPNLLFTQKVEQYMGDLTVGAFNFGTLVRAYSEQ